MTSFRREVCADGEANQVVRKRHGVGFVEIVDAPDEAAFNVPPGAEVFHMQIADRQHSGSLGKVRTNLWPELSPPVKRGTEERKYRQLRSGMLEAEVLLDERRAVGQPILKVAGCLDDVHTADDSGRK